MEEKEVAQAQWHALTEKVQQEGLTPESETAVHDTIVRLAAAHGIELVPVDPITGQPLLASFTSIDSVCLSVRESSGALP
ncbi:hypothetical protein ACOKM5_43045 [Streptomyces sp. BH097]|uniref:hypothetical protein n=1 Tax=unclassified Streptomyces TaxID=2593676 RepID=UPI003BB706FA